MGGQWQVTRGLRPKCGYQVMRSLGWSTDAVDPFKRSFVFGAGTLTALIFFYGRDS